MSQTIYSNTRSGLAILLLLLAACASAAPATIPDGEYSIGDDEQVYGAGPLILVLNQGHFSETKSGVGELSNGSFTIEGDKITFTEEVTSPKEKSMCGSKATYSYHWKFDAKKGELLFTRDKDECEYRAFVNTGGKQLLRWRRKTQDDG